MKRKQEKLDEKQKQEKLKELKLELIKQNVMAKKSGKTRIKEIKKAIARLLSVKSRS